MVRQEQRAERRAARSDVVDERARVAPREEAGRVAGGRGGALDLQQARAVALGSLRELGVDCSHLARRGALRAQRRLELRREALQRACRNGAKRVRIDKENAKQSDKQALSKR
jgi:hypothetical protein